MLAISSQNRAGYGSKQLDVFKESGGIEYAADIAMVLTRAKEHAAHVDYKELRLNVVKNRNGERGVIKFKFYPQRSQFVETGQEALDETNEE